MHAVIIHYRKNILILKNEGVLQHVKVHVSLTLIVTETVDFSNH